MVKTTSAYFKQHVKFYFPITHELLKYFKNSCTLKILTEFFFPKEFVINSKSNLSIESPKLRALRALLAHEPRALPAPEPHLPRALRALVHHVPRGQCSLVPHMSRALVT